ncbi:CAP domain-containing protein [Spirosoma panaciterrae]|uniref:CAP domain-containing protein n=1 Tax=Spirosoma panaciterrae TaxID=496058 RepID=UPI000370A837|nr:CAP domain-containing protein [Spirosoma panaciterrae]
MKYVYVFGILASIWALNACQTDQEKTGTPAPVMSSVHKEGGVGGPEAELPDHSGARDATMALQQEVLTYVNQARSQTCLCGTTVYPPVPALTLNSRLNGAADKYAVDMATYNYFSHTGRDGSQPWDRMTREGYQWTSAGENIAAGYPTARSVVDAWLSSPGHCQNIMNPYFQNLGVGYAYNTSSTYKHYWVNDFGRK